MTDSHITRFPGGMSFVGPDATSLLRAIQLRAGIKLHKVSGLIPTRGVTITRMFTLATDYTGQTYKRGEHDRAVEDLTVWIETMKSAIPVEDRT